MLVIKLKSITNKHLRNQIEELNSQKKQTIINIYSNIEPTYLLNRDGINNKLMKFDADAWRSNRIYNKQVLFPGIKHFNHLIIE